MRFCSGAIIGAIVLAGGYCGQPLAVGEEVREGEVLDPATYGSAVVESLDAMLTRARQAEPHDCRTREGGPGLWVVPGARASYFPRSGEHYATNKWGDTRMAIGFPYVVDIHGAYFAGQASPDVWTTGIRVVGYLEGEIVQETDWFRDLGDKPRWFAMNVRGVDRIEIVAEPVINGGGWYAMDDLTFSAHDDGPVNAGEMTVIDFEELEYHTKLTGSNYAGLVWEAGHGHFERARIIHPPSKPVEEEQDTARGGSPPSPSPLLMDGTLPTLAGGPWDAVNVTTESQWCYPPDTMGAAGLNFYIELVNCVFSVYEKYWPGGPYEEQMPLEYFFDAVPGSGDPRVLFDQHSQRWIAVATSFNRPTSSPVKLIYLAVSSTSDPTGDWFKTSFVASQGGDGPYWPDYPTLGVDENGIYIACSMIGRYTLTVFAIDKAPLISTWQSLGYIKAWRGLNHDGAIQPAHTYGSSGGEYLVSRRNSTQVRLYHVNPALTSLTVNYVPVSYNGGPPLAPALGSVPLDTLQDARLMMAMYRNGSIWTCHAINYSGRGACRWYEIDVDSASVVQYGTVADSSRHYFFPSLAVNSNEDVVMAFSGSKSTEFAGVYYTGRRGTDPPGHMAPAEQCRAGEGPYEYIDSYGRNRWGDYSSTCVDPEDDLTFFTVQEYAEENPYYPGTVWSTTIAKLIFEDDPLYAIGDLNCDGVLDFFDIDPFVLAVTDVPGYLTQYPDCDYTLADCNGDGVVDFFDIDSFVSLIAK